MNACIVDFLYSQLDCPDHRLVDKCQITGGGKNVAELQSVVSVVIAAAGCYHKREGGNYGN